MSSIPIHNSMRTVRSFYQTYRTPIFLMKRQGDQTICVESLFVWTETMNIIRDKILNYRERFKRLDRKWHVLVGAQLFFVLVAFRYNREQRRFEQQRQLPPYQENKDLSSSGVDSSSGTSWWQKVMRMNLLHRRLISNGDSFFPDISRIDSQWPWILDQVLLFRTRQAVTITSPLLMPLDGPEKETTKSRNIDWQISLATVLIWFQKNRSIGLKFSTDTEFKYLFDASKSSYSCHQLVAIII